MSWTKNTLSHFGLKRPYNFPRAIATIMVFFALFILTLMAAYWYWGSKATLQLTSPRMFFIGYISLLLVTVLVTLKWKVVSFSLLAWAYIELTLVLGTVALNSIHVMNSNLAPYSSSTASSVGRLEFHPMLMISPVKNWTSKSGLNIKHNSVGMRGKEIEGLKDKLLIHAYGGSTTYDIGVPNGSTWPEFLEHALGKEVVVANYGVPGYSSAEHIMQTAFYSNKLGRYPECSTYYIGWNDIRNSHIPTLDKAYADYHLLAQLSNLSQLENNGISAIYALVRNLNPFGYRYPRPQDFKLILPSDNLIDSNLEEIYLSNIRTIVTLNHSHGIKTIFIGQVLNREKLVNDNAYGWLPLVRDRDVWGIQEHFNEVLAREAAKLGVTAIVIDKNLFKDKDFIDNGHFSAEGSKKFAGLIAPTIQKECM